MLGSYKDPFIQPIDYTPTGKDIIDRGLASARRLLSPHTAVLHMLLSRLQAARYGRLNIMFLIQHLVMRSARSHSAFR
jgi:phosphatidylinositol 4-kinase